MTSASRNLARLIALLGFAGIAFLALRHVETRAVDIHLAARAEVSSQRFALADAPFYPQTDPRWADDKNGGSGEPLRLVGCTLCCLSMALAHHGIDMPPSELNRQLEQIGGYTKQGWIKWDALEVITAKHVRIDLPQNPSHQVLDAALRAGCPILVKVLLRPGVQHWVLLVGRDEYDYLMKDPLGDGKTLKPLATLNSDILAVRIVRKL